jgi:hypothetical protein
MQTHHRNVFAVIHTEGALLPIDLLQRIVAGDKGLGGLAPAEYNYYYLAAIQLPGVNHLRRGWFAVQANDKER